jgi:hypothetical protein
VKARLLDDADHYDELAAKADRAGAEMAKEALDRLERDQPAQYEKLLSERQRMGRR